MSAEVTDLLKAWMEESHRREQRCKEEQQYYKQERVEEKRVMNKKGPQKDKKRLKMMVRRISKRANDRKTTSQ